MLNNSYVMLEQNGFGEWLCTPKMLLCIEALTTSDWSVTSQASHGTSEWETLSEERWQSDNSSCQKALVVPLHILKHLHPMPSRTHPDSNMVVQSQTHVLNPGKSQKLQQKGHLQKGYMLSQSCSNVLKERQSGCTVLRACSTKQ